MTDATPTLSPAVVTEAVEACRLLEAAEDFNFNDCPECGGEGLPELCETCFPKFDEARLRRRRALALAGMLPPEFADGIEPLSTTELDDSGEAMACTGCGTTRTVAAIRKSSATAFTCCPERKMIPVRQMWSEASRLASLASPERPVEREAKLLSFVLDCSAGNPAHIGSARNQAVKLLESLGIEPRETGLFFHTEEADVADAAAILSEISGGSGA